MVKVSPSMLSADFSRMGAELERIERAGADWAHLDVMDGMFVPNITFGPPVIKALRPVSKLPFDVHLMIEDPVRYVADFVDAGADMLTVHAEARGDVAAAVEAIKDAGAVAGVSLNPGTPASALEPYLDSADMVLVMAVQPGFGGQSFQGACVPKLREISARARARGRRPEIGVDGGINRETGRTCAGAGATFLAAGSYLFKMEDMAPEIALWKTFGPGPVGSN